MTSDDAKQYDHVLSILANKSDRRLFSSGIDDKIEHFRIKAILTILNKDGFAKITAETTNDPVTGKSLVVQITPVGQDFLSKGGYVKKFESAEKENKKQNQIESRKNRNDSLRTLATLGSFILGGIALGRSFIAESKINEANTSIQVERNRIDNMVKSTYGPITWKGDTSDLRKFIEFMEAERKKDSIEKK